MPQAQRQRLTNLTNKILRQRALSKHLLNMLKNSLPSYYANKENNVLSPGHKYSYLNIATWNVRTMHDPFNPDHKINLLTKTMKERNIHITCVAETHWSTETEELFRDIQFRPT